MAKKKSNKEVKQEVVEESLSDLLGVVDGAKEELSGDSASSTNEKTSIAKSSVSSGGRLVGYHPITKEPVYK